MADAETGGGRRARDVRFLAADAPLSNAGISPDGSTLDITSGPETLWRVVV